jgi:phospholipase/carboxylesterase
VSTEIETQRINFHGWNIRLRKPINHSAPLLLLLHGWTGDENSMWVFARRLPPNYWILAPRGLYPAPEKGYSWREIKPGTWGLPSIEDLRPAADAVLGILRDWGASEGVDVTRLNLMGFSQGAGLCYTIALLYPQRVERLAGLAGFIPAGGEALVGNSPFAGKYFYVAHGIQVELIPIGRGRETVAMLQKAGAQVTFCEAETGHRVSAGCFSGLEAYWQAGSAGFL